MLYCLYIERCQGKGGQASSAIEMNGSVLCKMLTDTTYTHYVSLSCSFKIIQVIYLLLVMIGTLHPFTWLSSVSDTSIWRGSFGTQTVSCSWADKCRYEKLTTKDCRPRISLPFTKTSSQFGETWKKRAKVEKMSWVEFGTACEQNLTFVNWPQTDFDIHRNRCSFCFAFLKHSLELDFISTFMFVQHNRYFITDFLHFYSSCKALWNTVLQRAI